MKIKLLVISVLSLVMLNFAYAQNVPNGGFEDWEMRSLYEQPQDWVTANQETFMYGIQTAFKTDDAYSGSYAMRLEADTVQGDTLFGYAFAGGTIAGGELYDTLKFMGGFAVSAAPDSLFAYFKYEMAANDTGIVFVSFKKNGIYIGQNVYWLTGSQADYVKMGWEIAPMADVPDTAIIGFACSNPYNTHLGGYLQVDSLWFGDLPDVIPNADFENWQEESYQEPVHWVTANLFSKLFGGDISASPSADAHSGSLALRLEAIEATVPSDSGLTNMVIGFGMAYGTTFNFGEDLPKFPISYNPTSLMGYYKLTPAVDDTAMIYAAVYDADGVAYTVGTWLFPASEYTLFDLPLTYPAEVTIVAASIVASTTIHFMDPGPNGGELGTVLLLDDIQLVDPCESFAAYELASVTQATCEDSIAILDAGEGWDAYLWSNDSTTQVIEVLVTETATYSVTVTSFDPACSFSASAVLDPPTGCVDKIENQEDLTMSVSLYPNPSTGIITLEFTHAAAGQYVTEIMDITGKSLIRQENSISQADYRMRIDLSAYPEGLYLLKISGDQFTRCERVLIQ